MDLFLEMWSNVADAWANETLVRIVRQARLQAEAEKLLLARTARGADHARSRGGAT